MASIQDHVEPEIWFVDDLIKATSKDKDSKKEVTIPDFQRGLVWNKDKQEKLIESIKRGYPIGTLLVYKSNGGRDGKTLYNLIDGLQRTFALKQYSRNPNNFFTKDDVDDRFVDTISLELDRETESDKHSIRTTVTNWVQSVHAFTETAGWGTAGLVRKLIAEVLEIPTDCKEYYVALGRISENKRVTSAIAQFLDSVRDRSDISKVKIPVIVFTGAESDLPTVFELLNTKGTVLSRYEVFAAQWVKELQYIPNKQIRDEIWLRYTALEDESFTSDAAEDAPDEKSRKTREYTLFEYLFGLGQYMSKKFPRLFEVKEDNRPSSVAFNVMSACVGLRIANMKELPKKLRGKDRALLEQCILESAQFVDDTLKPVLSVKQRGRKKISIYHTEYQIVSMIATAFQVRYDTVDLTEKEGWSTKEQTLAKNILMNYLYDILRDYWRGSGDSKLHDYVENERHSNYRPSSDTWVNAIDSWFVDNQKNLVHKGRHVKDDRSEILFLKYIYAHKLTVVKNWREYHVEHIIPVNQLKKLKAADERLPINMIGNLALLEPKQNIKKGDHNFVEYLDKQLRAGKIDDQGYSQSLQDYSEQLLCLAKLIPSELTKSSYDDFLQARFELLKHEFLTVWSDHIPPDATT